MLSLCQDDSPVHGGANHIASRGPRSASMASWIPSCVVKSSSTVMLTNLHFRVCSVGVDRKLILSQHACTSVRLCLPFLPPVEHVDRSSLASAGAEASVLCCCAPLSCLVNRSSLGAGLVNRSSLGVSVSVVIFWHAALLACPLTPFLGDFPFGVSVAPPGPPAPVLVRGAFWAPPLGSEAYWG